MPGGGTPPGRSQRLAAGVAVAVLIALVAPTAAVAAPPTLQLSGTIRTNPFAGTSTRANDAEGSAYVARDDSLWLVDDNGESAYEVSRANGALKRTIATSEFRAAPRLGGGGTAGSSRSGDLESMAYDPTNDLLYAFSGKCCTSSNLPTAFRLKRGSDNKFRVESYQPLPSGSNFTGAALRPSDGKLYVGVGGDLRQYTYATNAVGSTFRVSGLSGILGMSFSDDSADLYVVTGAQKLYRVNWATLAVVSGWVFDLAPFGLRDSRAVERVGNQFYVLDGYDQRSSNDPLKYAFFILNIGGGGDITPPDTTITSGPSGSVSSRSATFNFSATEPGSFQCHLDAAPFATCTSPASYSNLTATSHTFEVRATDASGNTDQSPAARTWIVTDRPPVANAQSVSLNQGSTRTVTLTGSDPDSDPLRFKVTSLPAHGKVYDGTGTGGHLIATGELPYALTGPGNAATYQPTAGYSGSDAFAFKANDGQLDSTAAATVSITVNHVNGAPVANNDSATTPPATPVTVNVLANDSDPDNNPLTVTGATNPAHGTAVVNANNTITYTSTAGYSGPDSFGYTISDGNGGTASATVSITVDTPPEASAQSVSLDQDTTTGVTLTGSDPDNDPLRFKVTSLPAQGKLYDGSGVGGHLILAGELPYALTGAGNAATYQPDAGFSGPDSFAFKANDGRLDSTAAATVSITVNHVNHAPVASNDSATTPPATPVTVNVLANDSDPDNDALTVTAVSLPAHGLAVVNLDDTITYVPDLGYTGPDTFNYTVEDSNGAPASAVVSIAVGDPPVANAQSVSLDQDTTTGVTLTGSDPDNDPLRFKVTSLPAHGKLYDGTGVGGHLIVASELPYALTGAGNTGTYQPDAGFSGPDSFGFKANDGQLDSTAAATVSITVNHVNHPPVASNDSATTPPATPVTVNVLANDSDPDNDTLTVTGATTPAHGTAVVNANQTVTYTSTAGYSGPDSFDYTISDGNGGTASATVSIAVSSATTNLIGNSGFELNTSGWEAGASSNTLSRVAGGHSGGWTAQLSNTSAGGNCTIDDKPSWVGVTQAGAYTASVWVRSDRPGLTFKLRLREYKGGTQQGSVSTSVTLTSSWQQVTVVITPVAPGQSNLDFQAYTSSSPVGVCFQADDASITH